MYRGLAANEYYGPPRPGQSYQVYNEYMSIPIAGGVGIIAALAIHPVVGIAAGVATWLLSGSGGSHSNKPTQQGG